MIMTVGRSSRSPSFGQLDGLGREGDEQEKQEEKEQEEEKEEVKEREEEEEKAEKKTDDEGTHEAAYVTQEKKTECTNDYGGPLGRSRASLRICTKRQNL